MRAKKSLGQHWLTDETTLESICQEAGLDRGDTVLEIGSGHGSLTLVLAGMVKKVVAIELDSELAKKLSGDESLKGWVQVIEGNILNFDLRQMPADYKVVANIPYYLTSNLMRYLSESVNPPAEMAVLVQKEVAERICAQPGQMSILAVSVQLYYQCRLGQVVPAALFAPPPKVDSQLVLLKRHQQPLFADLGHANFFRVVKAGFSERRKKLRSSLSGGLGISKPAADVMLSQADVDGELRAQNLGLKDWYRLYKAYTEK